ncbi:MAG: glycosyltransferase family 4 protein [Acidobacteria bacterium]|nr:glycosyltransferase family 4 protein [Acidobacteriota bacterium]
MIYAWNYLEWGGAQVYFLGIAGRIADRAGILFVMPEKTGRQLIEFCETKKLPYELLPVENDLRPAGTLRRKLERHWNKFRAEDRLVRHLLKKDLTDAVVHVELAPWQSLVSLIRLCRRAKVFITMHNSLPPVPAWRLALWKLKFRLMIGFRNFHLFASNEDAKNSLTPFVTPEFLEKVKVTYTNVDPDEIGEAVALEIDRERKLAEFNLPPDKFYVFCVGQFIDRKGRWVFLEAARRILEKTADVGFVWISNSVLTSEERTKIEGFGLGENFRLLKSEEVGARHLDLFAFLRLADAFTLPSYVEGLPISLLEAMALGIPAVSTRINAIPEAVIHEQTGLLVEAGDAPGLAEALLRLKNDPTLAKKLAAAGRRHVLANFNEKAVAEIAFRAYAGAGED